MASTEARSLWTRTRSFLEEIFESPLDVAILPSTVIALLIIIFNPQIAH
jgi:uncharacterized RDD family membrane protein YckC